MQEEYIYSQTYLYPKQKEIYDFEKQGYRFCFTEAATKCGKSYMALIWIFEKALNGNRSWNYWWVSPFYSQATDMYSRAIMGLHNSGLKPDQYKTNKTELSIKIKGAGKITFKSGENYNSLMGSDVGNAVVDEASLVPEQAWENLLSTLTATGGTAQVIGNINGKTNWFYKICRRAERKINKKWIYHKLTCYDAVEAGLYTEEDIQTFKDAMSLQRFNELYLCIPSEDGSNPFGISNIYNCVMKNPIREDYEVVSYGVDLAKSYDWTAIVGLNKDAQIVYSQRWKGNWIETEKKLVEIVGNTPCLVDSTAAGDVVLEHINQELPTVEGYCFTNKSKGEIIEGLAVGFQDKSIGINNDWILTELENYELSYTKTGKIRYEGRKGQHDDGVCALALAYHKFKEVTEYSPLEFVFSSYNEDF